MIESYAFKNQNRFMHVFSADFDTDCLAPSPKHFAILIPSYQSDVLDRRLNRLSYYIGVGCSEFCFVGTLAESFHDAFDHILESQNRTDVITVACEDDSDGVEYFLYAAGTAEKDLVVELDDRKESQLLLKMLLKEFDKLNAQN